MAVKKSSKTIKKKWYKILAPALLKEVSAGETFLANSDLLIGKKMTMGLGSLTGEPQKHHTHVNLRVSSYTDGVFRTELLGWKLLPSAVKKMVRRNRSRIDDSFVIMTKDKKYVRVKPLIITRVKANRSVQTALRQKIRVEIAKNFALKDFNIIVGELLGRRFQHTVAKQVSKLFPVTVFDIRQFLLVDEDKARKMNLIRFVAEKKKEIKKEEIAKNPVENKETKEKSE